MSSVSDLYYSIHTGEQIDASISNVQSYLQVETTGDYVPSSSNKLTTVNKVNDLIDAKIEAAIAESY